MNFYCNRCHVFKTESGCHFDDDYLPICVDCIAYAEVRAFQKESFITRWRKPKAQQIVQTFQRSNNLRLIDPNMDVELEVAEQLALSR